MTASSESAALSTTTETNLLAPSPSRIISWASSINTFSRLATNCSKLLSSITTPLAPVAASTTASLVDVSLSTVMRLKDLSVTSCRARWSNSPSISASVATKLSMVAILGLIMPEPLLIPVMVICVSELPSRVNCRLDPLGRVSVVRMPSAASAQPFSSRAATASGIPASNVSIGRVSPITPVENGRTRFAGTDCRSPSTWQLRWASARPTSPVPALALPVLINR